MTSPTIVISFNILYFFISKVCWIMALNPSPIRSGQMGAFPNLKTKPHGFL